MVVLQPFLQLAWGLCMFVMSFLLFDHVDDLPSRAELVATFCIKVMLQVFFCGYPDNWIAQSV
jgi:hypothetical protein